MPTKILRLEDVPIDEIITADRFRVDMGDIQEMRESIEELGFFDPPIIDTNRKLYDGERRIRGAEERGDKTVPCIIIEPLDLLEALKVEQNANNVRKEFTWQEKMDIEEAVNNFYRARDPSWGQERQAKLRHSSQKTVSRRLDLAIGTKLFPELREFKTQDEASKAWDKLKDSLDTMERREKLPDYIRNAPKWASEHYRIGDAIDGMRGEPDESVHFAEVDPPYGVGLDVHKAGTDQIETYIEWSEEEYAEKLPLVASEVFRLLKNNSYAVFWYPTKHHCLTLDTLLKAKFKVSLVNCVWVKGPSGQALAPERVLASCYEPFFMVRKGNPKLPLNDGQRHGQGRPNVFDYRLDSGKADHATGKPLELVLDILQTIVRKPGSTILVPFLGSGVTLRAAYKLEMFGFGWDLSEKHREKFLKRVADDEKAKSNEDASSVAEVA